MPKSKEKVGPPPKKLLQNLTPEYIKTFSLLTGLLEWVGLDIFGPKPGRKNISSCMRLFLCHILHIPFVSFQLFLLSNLTFGSLLETAEVTSMFLLFIFGIIKMANGIIRREEIKEVIMEIGDLWPKDLSDDKKAAVLKNWLGKVDFVLKFCFVYTLIIALAFELIPFIMTCYNLSTGVKEYMFPYKPPVKVTTTTVFVAVYTWELMATVPFIFSLYIPFDYLIFTVTSNTSLLFYLLQIDLENAIQTRCSGVRTNEDSFLKIKRIVEEHQRLLRVVTKLNNFSGLLVFVLISIASPFICLFSFLTVVSHSAAETMVRLLTTLSATTTVFLTGFSGQLIFDASTGVADAAYRSLWYESDLKLKRLVLFIILRSQKPSYLSGLGFTNLSLRTFTAVMSTAWTYFSLLYQLYKEN